MHTAELWRWLVTDPTTGHTYRTRHVMADAAALAVDPNAQRVDHSHEHRLPTRTSRLAAELANR